MSEIDIHELREDGGYQVLSYAARGHHDPAAFVAALERDWWRTCDVGTVRHEHARNVPCGEDGGMVMALVRRGASTRGAYAVTTVEADDTRDATPLSQREVAGG